METDSSFSGLSNSLESSPVETDSSCSGLSNSLESSPVETDSSFSGLSNSLESTPVETDSSVSVHQCSFCYRSHCPSGRCENVSYENEL